MKGIIGKKIGMTQTFSEKGEVQPVTLVQAGPCVITQIKTVTNDGYSSVQLGMGSLKEKNKSKAYVGKFKNNNISIKSALKEFRVSENIVNTLKIGLKVTTSIFNIGDKLYNGSAYMLFDQMIQKNVKFFYPAQKRNIRIGFNYTI